MKNIFLKVYGCKVNQYELQQIREQLEAHGIVVVSRLKDADILLINTCTVTEGSDRELRYYIRKTRREYPALLIFLAGCYVSSRGVAAARTVGVDGIFTNEEKKHVVPTLCHIVRADHWDGKLRTGAGDGEHAISYFSGRTRAFVKIQDGCNRICSYCIVRLVRGKSRSRDSEEILAEIRQLVAHGHSEIVLTGIQIGAYGREREGEMTLAALLHAIGGIAGVRRIRISSIEPFDITDELIAAFSQVPALCRHLHISLQSGDDAVLQRMRRGYTRVYLDTVFEKLFTRVPSFTYSTDIIVGFPGEDDAAFARTQALLAAYPPVKVHAFPYSERPGTDAVLLEGKVPRQIIKKRVRALLDASVGWFRTAAAPFLATEQEVLTEHVHTLANGSRIAAGKTMQYIPVVFEGRSAKKNEYVRVRITTVRERDLFAVS